MAKLKIEINDVNNIRDLLQNAYNLSDEQIVQAQNEINKLSQFSINFVSAFPIFTSFSVSISSSLFLNALSKSETVLLVSSFIKTSEELSSM